MIVVHPHAQWMRNGMPNAKTYPYWREVIALLDDEVVQVGVEGEEQLVKDMRIAQPLKEIHALLVRCDYWVSVDSFLPHLAHHIPKPGVVLFSVSDPTIFGYPENLNLLKDRCHLRPNQFAIWEEQSYNPEAFLEPKAVLKAIREWIIPPRLSIIHATTNEPRGQRL